MAEAATEAERLVGAFEKNQREQVRAYLTEYEGQPMLDLRVWAELEDGQWVRTRKGITMSVDRYPELVALVEELGRHL